MLAKAHVSLYLEDLQQHSRHKLYARKLGGKCICFMISSQSQYKPLTLLMQAKINTPSVQIYRACGLQKKRVTIKTAL